MSVAMEQGQDQVEIGGLTVAFRRAGTGPPVILLHGATLDSRAWLRTLDDLSDEFTVVAWDAPGSGRSSDPPESFRLPDFADCLAGFIEALGLDRPHVVGVSFGAALALQLYALHSRVPRTLILVGAYAGWAGSLPPEIVAERLGRAVRSAKRPPAEWARDMVATYFSDKAPADLVDEVVAIVSDCRPVWTRTAAHALAEADLRDTLPDIRVPTLLLNGENDVRSPVTVAEDLQAKIPGSRLVVVPEVGHVVDLEAPERFRAEIREFMRTAT
jgi:pimeloyl-ACP methyl ester carboxylesterase